MANYNLTNQTISSSFEQLLQKDTDTGNLVNGLGEVVDNLVVTASYALTSSYSTNSLSASIANSATTALIATSASHAEVADEVPFSGVSGKPTLVSGSSQIDYPLISNIPSGIISSSEQLPSGLVSGSSQVSYPELSNIPSGIVSGSSQVVLEDTTYTDNGVNSFLQTDGAGNLSFQYVKSMYEEVKNREAFEIQKGQALFVDSNTGDRVDVYLADNSNPNRFPATLVASENISANGNGLGLISGLIASIDVGDLQSGDIVYLGTNGGWTATRPTGSADIQVLGVVSRPGNNGAGYFINQLHTTLPNITEGNVWVGDASGVPVQVSTGSFGGGGTIDTGSFATTGSNTFVGNQTITNDSKIEMNLGASINFYEGDIGPQPSSLRFHSGSDETANKWINFQPEPGGRGRLAIASFPENNHFLFFDPKDSGIGNHRLYIESTIEGGRQGDSPISIGASGLEVSGSTLTTGNTTIEGNTSIEGTNVGPANPLSVEDGTGTPILQVNNATLKGFTNADVLINGTLLNDGILRVQSAEGYGGGVLATNSVAAGNIAMNLGGDAGYSQALISSFDANQMVFDADTNILFQNTNSNGGKGAGNITFDATASINLNVNEDNIIFANGNMEVSGSNNGPGSTLQVENGTGTPILQVNNATLKGFTGVDVLVNGNTTLDGTVAIDDATRINGNLENTGSFTNGGDTTIVGTNTSPSQTFIAKDGNNTNRVEVNNATLAGLTSVDINLNGKTQITDTLTLQGDEVINGTNAAPGQTFIAKDGNSTNRLEVNNATLSGLTSVDVNINGKTQITDTLTLQGDGIVNGTNAAPGSTFVIKDGNSVNKLEVNNATLGGLTGVDVNINGTVQITETLKMIPQNPLPSGVVGELAVSGSNLYFYNGAWTQVV